MRRKERYQIGEYDLPEEILFSLLSPKSINNSPFHSQGYLDLDNICMVFQVYRCWRTDLKIRKVNSENSGLTRKNIMALLKGGTEGPLEMCGHKLIRPVRPVSMVMIDPSTSSCLGNKLSTGLSPGQDLLYEFSGRREKGG